MMRCFHPLGLLSVVFFFIIQFILQREREKTRKNPAVYASLCKSETTILPSHIRIHNINHLQYLQILSIDAQRSNTSKQAYFMIFTQCRFVYPAKKSYEPCNRVFLLVLALSHTLQCTLQLVCLIIKIYLFLQRLFRTSVISFLEHEGQIVSSIHSQNHASLLQVLHFILFFMKF